MPNQKSSLKNAPMCSAAELCHRKDCCFLSEKSNSPEKPEIIKPKPRNLDHSNLNCYTRPFQEMDYITVKSNKTKFAYVWYATGGNTYLCSALVAMKQMKALRSSAKLECEYVLLYSKDDESGKNIREDWLKEGK